jgi:hypothetical protein
MKRVASLLPINEFTYDKNAREIKSKDPKYMLKKLLQDVDSLEKFDTHSTKFYTCTLSFCRPCKSFYSIQNHRMIAISTTIAISFHAI